MVFPPLTIDCHHFIGSAVFFLVNVCALPYLFSSINGYADITLYIIVPVYIVLGIYSIFELQKRGTCADAIVLD